MAVATKFESFSEHLAKKIHDLHTDTVKLMLTNVAPVAATHTVKADLTDLAAGAGYTAGGIDVQNTVTRAAGVTTVNAVDCVWTSSGSMGPFRYVVAYNDTPTAAPVDPLIAFWDYASAVTLASGETFTADFVTGLMTIQ